MSLYDTTQRGWKLLHSAIFVIRKNPKLFLFPLLIGVFTIIIMAFFITPIIVVTAMHFPTLGPNDGPDVAMRGIHWPSWMWMYGLLLYPLSMFCATFCNVAFYSQILAALNGDPVSIRRGFQIAAGRIKSIFFWSFFAGIVGAIIREIESRLGFVGRIVTGLIGLTWSVASVFVIPVIIREQPTTNPIRILSGSAGTIKRTWGESLLGYVGVGALNMLALVCGLALFAAFAGVAYALGSFWILLPAAFLLVLGLVAYYCIANVAGQTYLCALYIYASEGVIPEPYSKELLDRAWKVKKS